MQAIAMIASKTMLAIVEEDTIYTIASLSIEEVGIDPSEEKPVMYFEEIDKGMVLNKTNASTLAKLFGDDYEQWAGNRVVLHVVETDFKGKQVKALRVREKKLAKGTPQPKKSAPVQAPLDTGNTVADDNFGIVTQPSAIAVSDEQKAEVVTLKTEMAKLTGVAGETQQVRALLQRAGKCCTDRQIKWNPAPKLKSIGDAIDMLIAMVAACEENDSVFALPF